MPSLRLATYRVAARMVPRLALGARLQRSLAGRRDAVGRWVDWARSRTSGPLIWVHAASVGEALTAEPVVRRLQVALPRLQAVLTYSSPSLASWRGALPFVAADYAPPEEPAAARTVASALAPDLLVFSRTDVWPELLLAAHQRGLPVAVLGGTVRPGSLRLIWPARRFLRELTRHVRFVGALTAHDAARWERLGVPCGAVSVTGDPRHDQVLERTTDLPRLGDLRDWAAGPTIVAGSVEDADEMVVLDAFGLLCRTRKEARLLLVPHDPTPAVVARLLERAAGAGVAAGLWRAARPVPDARCIIIDERGLLADLYVLAWTAYVGGGFRRGGLHAVIEPAAYGVPLVVGPDRTSADASRLLACGGAVGLPRRAAASALRGEWERWIGDPGARTRAGLAARAALQPGAAGLTARRLLELLRGG